MLHCKIGLNVERVGVFARLSFLYVVRQKVVDLRNYIEKSNSPWHKLQEFHLRVPQFHATIFNAFEKTSIIILVVAGRTHVAGHTIVELATGQRQVKRKRQGDGNRNVCVAPDRDCRLEANQRLVSVLNTCPRTPARTATTK